MGGRGAAGPGDVILAGFSTFGARWHDFVKIGAVTIVPVTVVAVALIIPFTPDVVGDLIAYQTTDPAEVEDRFEALQEVEAGEWIRWGAAYGLYALVSAIASTLALGASLVVAREHVHERPVATGDALRAALRRLPRLLLLMLLVWLSTTVGLLLCLLPGIWLLTSWSVAPAAVFHEDTSARRSMGRSFRLVRNRFWPTLLVVVLAFAVVMLLQTGVNSVTSILFAPAGEGAGRLHFAVLMVAGGIIGAVAIGVGASIITELYLDLVARAERGSPVDAPVPPPSEAFS